MEEALVYLLIIAALVAWWYYKKTMPEEKKRELAEKKADKKEQRQQIAARARQQEEEKQASIRANKAAGIPCCPKCGSTQVTANKKGFGAGKAAVGVLMTGGLIGLAAGGIGSKKVTITCLACGHQWKPGRG